MAQEVRDSLRDFASAVRERAAKADPKFRFGRFKVFIAEFELGRHGVKLLLEAHQAGLLRLSRADLTPAMDKQMVQDSEISYMNATFHFVDCE